MPEGPSALATWVGEADTVGEQHNEVVLTDTGETIAMKRRTLDFAFSIGGLLFAALLLVLGLVLNNQANFAKNYVTDQLAQQKIVFTPVEGLGGADKADGGECLVTYAGQTMTTGKQAECYANQYIGFHLQESADKAGFPGETYASLGGTFFGLQAQLQEAKDAGKPTEELQAQFDTVSGLRDTMFRGETLRGLLLTTYGFSIFGDRAATAALVCFLAAGLLALLSLAGLVHAFTTKKDETVLMVTHDTPSVPSEPVMS